MRKLTLEERVQRLEKLLVKSEAAKDKVEVILDTLLSDPKVTPGLTREDIGYNRKDQGVYQNLRVTDFTKFGLNRNDFAKVMDKIVYGPQSSKRFYNPTWNWLSSGNGPNEFEITYKQRSKPSTRRYGDSDSDWETDSDHKWRKYY